MAEQYSYNGALMPEIPADVLNVYPYAWCSVTDSSYKYSFVADKPWYVSEGMCRSEGNIQWRRADGEEWLLVETTVNTAFDLALYPVVWSNTDIANHSEETGIMYFLGMKAYRAVDIFAPDTFAVSKERMRGLADQARRLGKIRGGLLTPGQIEEVLKGVQASGVPKIILTDTPNHMISCSSDEHFSPRAYEKTENLITTKLDVLALDGFVKDVTTPVTLSGPMCHYNDVLLPGIPAEMLEKYPYAFIRKHTTDKEYQLIMSQTGFYLAGTTVRDNHVVISPKFVFPLNHSGETVWRNDYNVQYASWSTDEERVLHWSSHDLPSGSPEAQEIGFHSSAPEPLGKFYYNGTRLPGLARNMLAAYPYVWIRRNETSGYYDLFYSTAAFYVVDADSMSGSGITKPWYRVPIDSADTAESWTYYQESTAHLTIDGTRTALWANHDILNSADAESTDIYLAGSEPVPAE